MNQKDKIKVVLVQLGSPKSTKVSDVRAYLKEFLGDPRVVDINPLLWKIILNLFVLPFRPKKSAEAYARIYDGKSFPLVTGTLKFAEELRPYIQGNIEINASFLLSSPRPIDIFVDWTKEDMKTRAKEVYVLPQFPQYAESTIASGFDLLAKDVKELVNIPTIHFISHYHRSKAFIDGSVRQIKNYLKDKPNTKDIVISFHGIPLRRVLDKKDIYYRHCFETYHLILKQFDNDINFHFTFQSRFGSEQWLGPATDEYVMNLKREKNINQVGVYCASFVVDCLETTDEIGNELADEFKEIGGECDLIPCLNNEKQWTQDYAHFINVQVHGSRIEKNELYYDVDYDQIVRAMPEQKRNSEPMDENAKKTIKIVFLTLFLDLIGFSIIFPLFPALAKYYLEIDQDNFFLKSIFGAVNSVTSVAGQTGMSPIVLFGGALGALYSLLQFVAAPFWGGLSDRIGRKPVLLVSVFGLFISYVLWILSGSFTVLILARFIGGIMGGNISTATAVVADVTTEKNRSKGMAFVGIAFALGFILGPALGGAFSTINLLDYYPGWANFGINPFSVPAIIAALLCLINLYYIAKNFKETLSEDSKNLTKHRTSNILKIFKPLPIKSVNYTNFGYFFFLTFFSGMEFTLTFLAVERLGFSPMQNAYMFVFIGVFIALTQGGYVRRKANIVGERKMAVQGLIATLPGLLLIAFAHNTFLLYFGLFFLSIGSAMVIPNLTALVSIYSPKNIQGQSLGIFRSLGALGRVIGPIIASLLYWRYNSAAPYIVGSVMMLVPIMIIKKLPSLSEPLDQ